MARRKMKKLTKEYEELYIFQSATIARFSLQDEFGRTEVVNILS